MHQNHVRRCFSFCFCDIMFFWELEFLENLIFLPHIRSFRNNCKATFQGFVCVCVCVCVHNFVNQANRDLKIPLFQGTGMGRTPNFSVVFHIFPCFFSYLVITSYPTTREPSHLSRVNSCLLVLTSTGMVTSPYPYTENG